MGPIICTYPLELVHLDFLTIGKEGSDKNKCIDETDHFMHYTQAFITPKQMAPCVAKNILGKFSCSLWMARQNYL